MKNLYLRSSVFISVKSIVFNLVLLVTGWFVGTALSTTAYAIIFACVYAVMTFMICEVIYMGNRIRLLPLTGQIVMMYVIDMLISIGLFSWYYDRNLFAEQVVSTHLLYGSIFIISAVSSYILKKRMAAMHGGVEGLM